MTGSMTCNSRPVDILGVQLVPGAGFKYGEKESCSPPTQLKATSRVGQPYKVLLIWLSWPLLMRNCDVLTMGSTPKSTKGAKVTGPMMVMRYSVLLTRLKSPPGCTMVATGNGMV